MDFAILSTRVELGTALSLGVNQLQVQVVVLSSDQDGDGARVVLGKMVRMEEDEKKPQVIAAHTGKP